MGVAGMKGLRIILDLAGRPPWWQMALDEAVLEAVASGSSPPTLRFYVFSPTSVTIGLFQSVKDSVDLDEARRLGVPVVRRFTGGGSVLHAEGGELTYSVALPTKGVLGDVVESFRLLCGAVARGLRLLGVEARVEGVNDVVAGGRKVSGNAQARRGGALLQHGTVLLRPDRVLMERLLKAPREKLASHGVSGIGSRVIGVEELLGRSVGVGEVAAALRKGFEETLGLRGHHGWFTERELEMAWKLVEKYRSERWLMKR